jgi:hypothetical protein
LSDRGVEGAFPLLLDEHGKIELLDVDFDAGLAELLLD